MSGRHVHVTVCLVLMLTISSCATRVSGDTIETYYSFADADSGGIASVSVDPQTRRFVDDAVVLDLATCRLPAKLRRRPDGNLLALANLDPAGPHLFLVNPTNLKTRSLHLPSIPDELRFTDDSRYLFVTCELDAVVRVDTSGTGKLQVFSLASLKPDGNAAEDICLVDEDQLAIISCQKDSRGGKKKGNRLVLLETKRFQVAADIALPRDRFDLHVAGNPKEQGPGPEVVAVSRATDTLAVTLDLYGGIALLSWSAAREGRLDNYVVLNASPTEQWGTAFPDRARLIHQNNRDYFLVCNAGVDGGATLIDLHSRQIVWRQPTPPGLEQPIYVAALNKAFTVASGKTKRRVDREVTKVMNPLSKLFVFDLRNGPDLAKRQVEVHSLPHVTVRLQSLSESPPLLLLAGGADEEHIDTFTLWDPVTSTICDQRQAHGIIQQFER